MTGALLNPCDLFLLMLDGQIRRAGLAGNTCIALLRMESPPDAAELWDYAANLVHSRPKLDARLEFTPFLRRPRWR